MMPAKRCTLSFEQLESRDCPTVFVNVHAGNLGIFSINSSSLSIVQTNATSFQVRENGAVVANVGGVTGSLGVVLGAVGSTNVDFDFNGFGTINHVALFLGVNSSDVTVHNGTIQGTLNIQGGLGRTRVFLGGDGKVLNVNGSTHVSLPGTNDVLFVRSAVTLKGRVDALFVNRVFFDAGSTAEKNVFVLTGPFGGRLDVNGTVGGGVLFTGSMFADIVNIGAAASIATDLNVGLRGGNDTVNFAGSVGNDFNIFSAPFFGNKNITVGGTIGHDANFNLGLGSDTVRLNGIITNHLLLFTRFGQDFVVFDDAFAAANADVNLGWSDDEFCLHATASVTGSAVINGGNNDTSSPGDRFVTPLAAVPGNYTLINFETVDVLTVC